MFELKQKFGCLACIALLISILGICCKEPQQDPSETRRQREFDLNVLELEEIAKGGFIDSTFLSFRFGMTEDEYLVHAKNLQDSNILILEDGSFKYLLVLDDHQPCKGDLFPKFYDGKLYEIDIRFKLCISIDEVFILSQSLQKKYNSYKHINISGLEETMGEIWLNRNQKIAFCLISNSVHIKYMNNLIKRQLFAIDSAEMKMRKQKSWEQL